MATTVVHSAENNGSGTSILFLTNAARTVGDLGIIWMSVPAANTVATLTGWTLLNVTVLGASRRLYAFSRVVPASDTSQTFTMSATGSRGAVYTTLRGARVATPVDVGPAVGYSEAGTTTLVAPTVTTVAADTLLLCFFAAFISSAAHTLGVPAGMTQVIASKYDSVGHSVMVAQEDRTTPGATGTRSSTQPSSVAWGASTLAVAPEPTPSPPPDQRMRRLRPLLVR